MVRSVRSWRAAAWRRVGSWSGFALMAALGCGAELPSTGDIPSSGGLSNSGGLSSSGGVSGGTGGQLAKGGAAGAAGMTGSVCTSGMYSSAARGDFMNPGRDCTACHDFTIAGTVFPTLHEPDLCLGLPTSSGVTVELTDANGVVLTLTPNDAGTFYSRAEPQTPAATFTFPYSAVIKSPRGTRAMMTKQMRGNCNSCHSEAGTEGAPGRIQAP